MKFFYSYNIAQNRILLHDKIQKFFNFQIENETEHVMRLDFFLVRQMMPVFSDTGTLELIFISVRAGLSVYLIILDTTWPWAGFSL
jgi:hypothetical protein